MPSFLPTSARPLALAGALLAAVSGAACTPVTSYNGFQAIDVKPADIKAGVDTRLTVQSKLGSPSSMSTFDPNTWFYISQTMVKYAYYLPKASQRDVTEIKFDKDQKVASVRTLKLKDGYQIAYGKRETPTRGREVNVLEQILGTVGRGSLLPQDNDPGNPRGHR